LASTDKTCWTVRPFALALLLAVLFAIVVAQAFPQAVLDFSDFHGNNSPLQVHARSTSAPVIVTVAVLCLTCTELPREFSQVDLLLRADFGSDLPLLAEPSLRI